MDSGNNPESVRPELARPESARAGQSPETFRDGAGGPPSLREAVRGRWQLPVLAAGGLLLVGAIGAAIVTAPKPEHGNDLELARALVADRQYARALDQLNDKVLPVIEKGRIGPDQRREFHVLRARALYLGQREANLDRPENNANIVAEYREAESRNATLEPRDVFFLANTLISMGRLDDATARAMSLPEADRDLRQELLRRMIDLTMSEEGAKLGLREPARALDLLAALTSDPALKDEDRLWALSRQARLLVEQGYAEDAIIKVLRELPRMGDETDEGARDTLPEILTAMARAYVAVGDAEQAGVQLDRAAALLSPDAPAMGEIALLQAGIEMDRGDATRAREKYLLVAERFGHTSGLLPALLGLAEAEMRLANEAGEAVEPEELRASSVERYASLVEKMRGGEMSLEAPVERVTESLLARTREAMERDDARLAIRLSTLAESLYGPLDAPAPVLRAVARATRRAADQLLQPAGGTGVLSLLEVDPATRREARELLVRSGDAARRHAAKVVLLNDGQDRDSLWEAADAFDRAGDLESSLAAFQQFAEDFPQETRRHEAMFRAGRAQQARGDLTLAAQTFRSLKDDPRAGPFADASHVPLAQCLLDDGTAENDAEAETLLQAVVAGSLGGPSTASYRDALRELGEHQFATGRFEQAIGSFEEFLSRMGVPPGVPEAGGPIAQGRAVLDAGPTPARQGGEVEEAGAGSAPVISPEVHAARSMLAQSHKSLASSRQVELRSPMPEGDRRRLEEARDGHLRSAMGLFEEVRRGLEGVRQRTALQDLMLRNAYLALGDCAFDLRDWDGAIRAYDAARERFPREPSSLVAMTQIVAALLEQGRTAEARVANTRARRFYESLPEHVWSDPALPMSRQDWERWLDSQAKLGNLGPIDATASAAPASSASVPEPAGAPE